MLGTKFKAQTSLADRNYRPELILTTQSIFPYF